MSTSSLHDWIQQQSAQLKNPDINLLLDLFVTSPSDAEVSELCRGVLGESPQILNFITSLNQKRQQYGVSKSTSQPTPSQPPQPSKSKKTQEPTKSQPQPSSSQSASQFKLDSYSQPTVLSAAPAPAPQSFAQITRVEQPAPQHSKSFDSSVFWTESDVAVLDVAKLMHQEVTETPVEPEENAKELFPSLNSRTKGGDGSANNKKLALTEMGFEKQGITVVEKKAPKPQTQTPASPTPPTTQETSEQRLQQPHPQQPPEGPYLNHITVSPSLNASRPECNCMAREHKFYANCHDCGRIICQFEGEGDCFYCGAYVINFTQNKELTQQFRQYQSKTEDKLKKNAKAGKSQIVSRTRQTLYDSVDSNQVSDLFGTAITEKNIQQLNIDGEGVFCISNEMFFEKMDQWRQNAQGYYLRHSIAHPSLNNVNLIPVADSRVSSTDIRTNSAYGAAIGASNDVSDDKRLDAGFNQALQFRNTLLQREKEKAKRTHVIDEQADYYDFESNIWLDEDEKTKKALVAQTVEQNMADLNETRTLTVEFDPKTGKMKQTYHKTDLSMKGIGSVGGGMSDLVEQATQTVEKTLESQKQLDDSHIEVINATDGRSYSRAELAQRKEFFLKRRVDIEKQKKEAAEAAAKEAQDKGKQTVRGQRATQQPKPDDQITKHLSGRSLLVYQSLLSTLAPENPTETASTTPQHSLSWTDRLSALDQIYDAEYSFYTEHPEQSFTPLYAEPVSANAVVENTTDSGCG